MKLHEVPASFQQQYLLSVYGEGAKLLTKPVYIHPEVCDSKGQFPRSPMKLVGIYPGGIVKLAHNGEQFILRTSEVLTTDPRTIIAEYMLEQFEAKMQPILSAKDAKSAAFVSGLPAVAVYSKLAKAKRHGIPVPSWAQ
jgi:hypothetical protein